MSKLTWGLLNPAYETGLSMAVVYKYDEETDIYGHGIPWSGLISVTETPNFDTSDIYADGEKVLSLDGDDDLSGSIEAYTYPPEIDDCFGMVEPIPGMTLYQQDKKLFGLCYRVSTGENSYAIHILYKVMAGPSDRTYSTVNADVDLTTFEWDFTTEPVIFGDSYRPFRQVILDSSKLGTQSIRRIEAVLYGVFAPAKLPSIADILSIIEDSTSVGHVDIDAAGYFIIT